MTLTWDDPGDTSITGYQVLRRPRDGEEYKDGKGSTTFVAIENDTGSSATSYTDISVTPHTRYVYRVKAKNGGGLGPRSSYVNVETSEAPEGVQSVPAKPAGLVASSVLDNSVTFEWDDPGNSSITHYKVLRREGDSGSFTAIEDSTGSADAAHTDATVSAETGYEYRVIAVNGSGESPESDSLSVQTLPAPSSGSVVVPETEPEEDPIAAQQILETDIPAGYGTVFTATMTLGERTVGGDDHVGFSTQGNGAISSTTFSIAGVNYDLERFEQVFSGIVNNAGFWLDVGGRLPDDAVLLVDNERVRVGLGDYTAGAHRFSDQTFPEWRNGQTREIRILGPVYDETTNDFSAGIASPGNLGVGFPGTASIDRQFDKDWFSFTLEAGKVYRIDMLGADTGDGELRDPHLSGLFAVFDSDDNYQPDGVINADGERVRPLWRDWDDDELHLGFSYYNDDGGQRRNARMFLRTDPSTILGSAQGYPAGVYYIEAAALLAEGETGGSYRMTLTEITDDDTSVRSLTVGNTAAGELDWPADQDAFEVTVTGGTRYAIVVRPTGWWRAHWRDRYDIPGVHVVRIIDDVETVVSSTNSGHDRGIYTYTPAATGSYRIVVSGRGTTRQDFGAGPYSLRLIVDRESEEKTEAATVSVGGAAVNASIGYRGDIDWFKVDLSPGIETSKTFRVDVRGLDTDGRTPADPFIDLDGPAERGDSLENADGGEGGDARAYVTVGDGEHSAGTWHIRVTDPDGGEDDYELTVVEVPDTLVWTSRMFPTHSGGVGSGFCAPVLYGRCAVDSSVPRYGHLDDTGFTYGGGDYEVLSIRYSRSAASLWLHLNELFPEADLAQLTLTVNGVDYALSDATVTSTLKLYAWGPVNDELWTVGNLADFVLLEISRTP